MLKRDQCWRYDAICSTPTSKILCSRCGVACYCSDKCKLKGSDEFRHQVDCQTAALKRKCSGCNQEKIGLKSCGGCREAWYCDKECQKKAWPTHKHLCRQVLAKISELSERLNDIFDFKNSTNSHGVGTVYYWGNTPATDVINLPLNERCDYSKPLSVLAFGVGDPRNIVRSLCDLPEAYKEEITFTLNDICACTLARTVLILYFLFKRGEEVTSSVTQMWYSLRLSDMDYRLVISRLQELVEASSLEELTEGTMKMNQGHFQRLVEVWRTWLDLSSRQGDWITEARNKRFTSFDAQEGMDLYLKQIPKKHKESASDWFATGILLPKESRKELLRENFTLTGSDFQLSRNKGAFSYLIQSSVLPFAGWDYNEVRQWGQSVSLLKMYSEYVSHVLKKSALKLATGRVKFHFLSCNCMEIARFVPQGRRFDRVTTSNIADFVPFPSILDTYKPLLNLSNPSSVIVTEFLNWVMLTDAREEVRVRAHFKPKGDSFGQKVLEDTKNTAVAYSRAFQSFVEYHDHSGRFIQFLEELTKGTMKMNQGHFQRLVEVWRTWLDLSTRQGDWITEVGNKRFTSFDAQEGMDFHLKEIPKKHKESATDWFANGILSPKESQKELLRENFTLTGSDFQLNRINKGAFSYLIQSSVLPFAGWDYNEVSQWGQSASLLKMYSEYVSHLLKKSALKLATGRVKFHFLLYNCMEIARFVPQGHRFDRVTTSNIADFVPLPSILDTYNPLLNVYNPFSVIITEYLNWSVYTDVKKELLERAHFMPKSDSFRRKVLEDTKNPAIAYSRAYQSLVEYHDHSGEFIQFLRAAVLVSKSPDERNRRRTWKSVADYNGLVARDFNRCQNRVFPAKWMLNCRRVSLLNGFERAVEWIIHQS